MKKIYEESHFWIVMRIVKSLVSSSQSEKSIKITMQLPQSDKEKNVTVQVSCQRADESQNIKLMMSFASLITLSLSIAFIDNFLLSSHPACPLLPGKCAISHTQSVESWEDISFRKTAALHKDPSHSRRELCIQLPDSPVFFFSQHSDTSLR